MPEIAWNSGWLFFDRVLLREVGAALGQVEPTTTTV